MKVDGLDPFDLNVFKFKTLIVNSKALLNNPLGDPTVRRQFILCPKSIDSKTPVVFYLSGYGSDAWKNFSFQDFDLNLVQQLDQWTWEGLIPEAIYVFVNAWTKWGGSQFINSSGSGMYEDYILQDLIPEFQKIFPSKKGSNNWLLMGGSSGGYGALHLGSKSPELFPHILALAPDSLFQVSLLPEIYKYLPYIQQHDGLDQFIKAYQQGLVKLNHDILFGLLNLVAMTHCYAPKDSSGVLKFPIQEDGRLDQEIWDQWQAHDPIQFLPRRVSALTKLKSIHLFTGDKDEYGLQFGSRQIYDLLKSQNLNVMYSEQIGTHRSLKNFRCQALMAGFKAVSELG